MKTGTPNTVEEAIENALAEIALSPSGKTQMVQIIRRHIKDFMAQRFGLLTTHDVKEVASESMAVWRLIFPLKKQ